MNLKNTLKLKRFLKKKDWKSIKKMMMNVDMKHFRNSLKMKVIFLALENGEQNLINQYLVTLKEEERLLIFKEYYKDLLYISNNIIFELYFSDFFKIGLEYHSKELLYHLAKIVSLNPTLYRKELIILKVYFEKEEVDDILIGLANLEAFHSKELDQKIIDSGILNIINYMWYHKTKYMNELLTKYLENDIDIENIRFLAKETKEDDFLYQNIIAIISKISDRKRASEYLYLFYEEHPKYSFKNQLIIQILELEDFHIIQKLINTLSEKEQDHICKKYIETKNSKMIFVLACVTNCNYSYQCIDYVLKTDQIFYITILISFLKSHHLRYVFKKMIKGKDSFYYLDIIDQLYLFQLPNYLEMIDYIFTQKLEYLFPKEVISNFITFKNEVKQPENDTPILKK